MLPDAPWVGVGEGFAAAFAADGPVLIGLDPVVDGLGTPNRPVYLSVVAGSPLVASVIAFHEAAVAAGVPAEIDVWDAEPSSLSERAEFFCSRFLPA